MFYDDDEIRYRCGACAMDLSCTIDGYTPLYHLKPSSILTALWDIGAVASMMIKLGLGDGFDYLLPESKVKLD